MIGSKTLDFTNLSNELKLQVEMLKADHLINSNRKLFKGIDWNEFVALTIHHRTFCTLYKKIKQLNEEDIPGFVIQKLERLYKNNIYQMLHLSGEMERVNKLMNEKDINFLLLKGPALAKELYGDISLRTSCDIDLLVPIDDLERMDSLLLSLGYVKNDYFRSILNDWKWRHHHVTYFHPVKEVKLEVHWRLNPGPASEPSFQELWERRKLSKLSASPLNLLGDEDLFLFLSSHGARHGWSRLRWLLDINQILKKGKINTENLKKIAEKHGYTPVLGQSIRLASELFDIQVTGKLLTFSNSKRVTCLTRLAIFYLERKVNLHTYPVPEDISQYHKNYLFFLKSPMQKFVFVMSLFYPYPEDQDILPLPKGLHFLYFPLRPLIWLWKKAWIRTQAIR